MKKAIENGYSIIRLVQEEVWSDTFDWKSELFQAIKKCNDIPQVIYISKDQTIYQEHQKKMNK